MVLYLVVKLFAAALTEYTHTHTHMPNVCGYAFSCPELWLQRLKVLFETWCAQAASARALDLFIEYAQGHKSVWMCTREELAKAASQSGAMHI
jgi:hypothetical protein